MVFPEFDYSHQLKPLSGFGSAIHQAFYCPAEENRAFASEYDSAHPYHLEFSFIAKPYGFRALRHESIPSSSQGGF